MWTDVWKAAEVIGLAIGAAGAVVLIGFLVWREIRKHMKEALEPIEAEVRPSSPNLRPPPPAVGASLDSLSLRNLVELATSSIQNIHSQLGQFVTLFGRLDDRMTNERSALVGSMEEHKRLMEAARQEDRRQLGALALRVSNMESAMGKRGFDVLMEQQAAATVAIAEALTTPNPNTPPTGVPKIQTP